MKSNMDEAKVIALREDARIEIARALLSVSWWTDFGKFTNAAQSL